MTIKYLSDEQALKYVIELENFKDRWLEKLDACALDGDKTLDDVLCMLLSGVRVKQPIHVRLYEVRPLNSTSVKAIKEVKAHNDPSSVEYDLDMVLYLKFDTLEGVENMVPDLAEEKRYLPIINGTVIGDAYMGEMPMVCVDRPLDLPESQIVGKVHYGEYKNCRLSKSHNRAAFPMIDRRTQTVEYIVVIEKQGSLLNQHEIRYVRNLLARAHEAIVIKDLENRTHLHEAYLRRRLHDLKNMFQMIDMNIGLAQDLISIDGPTERINTALTDAKNNFNLLTELLKYSNESQNYYDMQAHPVGAIVQSKLMSYEQYDFYKGHLSFQCRFDDENKTVLIDKKAFCLALDNMTKNSFEALKNPDGSIDSQKKARVSISTCLRDDTLVLRYFDNCGGMDPMLYDSVIRRGACRTTKKDGAGVGVASILSTFRDMGYVIDPVNKPGTGFGYEIALKIETDSAKHVYMDMTTGTTFGS